MELSTEVNQCVIIQYSGAVEFITEKQAEYINQGILQGSKGITREGGKGFLFFSSIADMMTLEKYYEKFPDRRPETPRNKFEDLYGREGSEQIRQPTEHAKEQMRRGFIEYHLGQGRTQEQAELKWKQFMKAGVDYSLAKKLKEKMFI
jgi:hypothetical protein